MIKGRDLDNREDGPTGGPAGPATPASPPTAGATTRRRPEAPAPRAIEQRIDAAKLLRAPAVAGIHCGCCWGQGRDAAIHAIEGPAGE